ncbi:adenylate/guanylate cyclase domain-containing protein [Laspinema olomoucense]|uniref:adenylate/guanylate cyclase domain-containing protein n=1 Tax=Laspinema olomoucense TaxID=3231600 RepID=UPI0021BB59C5|nr:adenylate/guanylate cyclase domain-containing protein [Laspinema sp. D3d]MCT7976006.1 adenylate/guanylate cyclase domain-containing protein [Laspinema sp. D3d]
MKKWHGLNHSWRSLNITAKFSSAFFGLMLILGGVATTGWLSLNFVRTETQATIVSSIKLQRLVFEMNDALDKARRLERDFFEQWSKTGFLDARQEYAKAYGEQIDMVLLISDLLQSLLATDQVSATLRQSNPSVVSYEEMVQQYASSFREAVGLVGELGMDETGILARLQQNSQRVGDILQLADDPELLELYTQLQSREQDYIRDRQNPERAALYQAIEQLQSAIKQSPNLSLERQLNALKALTDYQVLAQQIIRLDLEIRTQLSQFDRQAAELSAQLLEIARQEIQRGEYRINQTSQAATGLLVAALLLALVFASAIAQEFVYALKQLQIEQAKSESLLLNILPKTIADRLKEETTTIADQFTDVTVLFADIVGFTTLSSRISPTELVTLLNEIFSEFDRLADLHGLEKIKTIGDAYMLVGGLPEPKADCAIDVAEMALDMQQAIKQFNLTHQENINIRIGINTGSVVAGVIGQKKFIYDLWGDAVNIASRMESHGLPGSIQVSEDTYQVLANRYQFEERGSIAIKGKGEMKTYFLLGKNSEKLEKEPKLLPFPDPINNTSYGLGTGLDR